MLLPVLCMAAAQFGLVPIAIVTEVLVTRRARARQQRIIERRNKRRESVSCEESEFAYRELPTIWDTLIYRAPWLILAASFFFLFFPGIGIMIMWLEPTRSGLSLLRILAWILVPPVCGILALMRAYTPIPTQLEREQKKRRALELTD